MAQIQSFGIHTPVGLSYLVREGILPPQPKPEQYQWETYVFDDGSGDVDEELLITKDTVVWSQGQFVRNVYRFVLDGEVVVQALLTSFPTPSTSKNNTSADTNTKAISNGYSDSSKVPKRFNRSEKRRNTLSRALVVFLKTKAHIYFQQGASHIIDLPFEIERALPAPPLHLGSDGHCLRPMWFGLV